MFNKLQGQIRLPLSFFASEQKKSRPAIEAALMKVVERGRPNGVGVTIQVRQVREVGLKMALEQE